jgi:hypothetical protein
MFKNTARGASLKVSINDYTKHLVVSQVLLRRVNYFTIYFASSYQY